MLPLQGVVCRALPPNPCNPVTITGQVSLAAFVAPLGQVTEVLLVANLVNVTGVDSSGAQFTGAGSAQMGFQRPPGPPIVPPLTFLFILQPPGPPNRTVLPVLLTLQFGADGSVVGATATAGATAIQGPPGG